MGVNSVEAAGIDAAAPMKHLTIGDFRCEVLVEDVSVEVYGVERKEKEQSGYIISEEGKRFKVRLHDDRVNPTVSVKCDVVIDGLRIGHAGLLRHDKVDRPLHCFFDGKLLSPTTIAPFLFSGIKLSDEMDECNTSPGFLKNVGTIGVRIHRVNVTAQKTEVRYVAPETSKVVHETTKKGMMSHTTALGAAETTKMKTHWSIQYLDPKDKPLASFNFYYRSRDLLELQSIIPTEQIDVVEEVPDEKPAVAGPGPKSKSKKRDVIVLDSDEEEESSAAEPERLRRENAEYKKAKLEQSSSKEKDVPGGVKVEELDKKMVDDM